MREIVARGAELAAVRAFVEGTDAVSAALVLEGEAGIGKSTLWLAAVKHAHAHGASVLSARPAEAEQGLAHVGLGDLLDGVFDDVAPGLSRPRRRALESALLREEAADATIDHRALAVAVHDALHLLGERGRLLVAIDDAQWLDVSTSSALAFALRRLEQSSVRLLHRSPNGTDRTGAGARRMAPGMHLRGPAECRSASPALAGSSRQGLRPAEPASHPRALGRESRFLRWSWHARSTRTSARSIHFLSPRRSTSSYVSGLPGFPAPRARRSPSRRR